MIEYLVPVPFPVPESGELLLRFRPRSLSDLLLQRLRRYLGMVPVPPKLLPTEDELEGEVVPLSSAAWLLLRFSMELQREEPRWVMSMGLMRNLGEGEHRVGDV